MATTAAENEEEIIVESAATSEVADVQTDQGLVRGSELWFTEVVGLPNWGIDPRKDTNHISNADLLMVFSNKVNHKGYSWKECKSEKVKKRMQELYKPVFQAKSMPRDVYVCESFARAVLSEVFNFTNINWALLGEEKWRGKTVKSLEVEVYKEPEGGVTYRAQVLKKLKAEKVDMESEISLMEDDQRIAEQKVEDIRSSIEGTDAEQIFQAQEVELQKFKSKISMEELDLNHSKKMLEYFKTETADAERVMEFEGKVSTNETRIRELKKEYRGLERKQREGNKSLLSALQSAKFIKETISTANALLVEKGKTIELLSNPSRRPMALTPSTFIEESDSDEEEVLGQKHCALCGRGFPKFNIVVASCKCLYHPWCVMTQSWISLSCAADDCKQLFKAEWKRSMGLINSEDELQKYMADWKRSPDPPRKGHLNSDIGGQTPKTKLHRSLDCSGSSRTKSQKRLI